VTIASDSDISYDPFSVEIDKDPHLLWKRMRDEMPLYRNECAAGNACRSRRAEPGSDRTLVVLERAFK